MTLPELKVPRQRWIGRYRALPLVFGVGLYGLCAVSSGLAADTDAVPKEVREVVENLQARYQRTKDLKADFTQTTRIEGFSTPISSKGRVYIKKPGKLRWDYRDPNVEEIYVNGNDVNMYVPEHNQVLIGTLTRMTASRAPLQLLQGVANLEEQFQVVATEGAARGAGGLPLVTLLPRPDRHETVQTMSRVVLEVQPKTYYLKTVAIHEVSGNVSTFRFTNLKANTGLKDELFRFQVPPGVEVVRAPALSPP